MLTSLLSLTHLCFFTVTLFFPCGNFCQAGVPVWGMESCCEVPDMPPPHAAGWAPDRLTVFPFISQWCFYDFFPWSNHCCFWSWSLNRWSFGRVIKRRGPCGEWVGKPLQKKREIVEGPVWGEGERAVGGKAEPLQRAQTLKAQGLASVKTGLGFHSILAVSVSQGILGNFLQLRRVISPSDQFLLLRKYWDFIKKQTKMDFLPSNRLESNRVDGEKS